jgi:hypothetical protein
MRLSRVVCLIALLLSVRAFAQTTGAIEGVVTDATGAAIPGAAAKLIDTGTGVATSDSRTRIRDLAFVSGEAVPDS